MPRLVFRGGDGNAVTVRIEEGQQVRVGRDPESEIHLPERNVSREHCVICSCEGLWRVVDTGSRGGTYLNGETTSDGVLADGDVIRVGRTEMRWVTAVPGSSPPSRASAGASSALRKPRRRGSEALVIGSLLGSVALVGVVALVWTRSGDSPAPRESAGAAPAVTARTPIGETLERVRELAREDSSEGELAEVGEPGSSPAPTMAPGAVSERGAAAPVASAPGERSGTFGDSPEGVGRVDPNASSPLERELAALEASLEEVVGRASSPPDTLEKLAEDFRGLARKWRPLPEIRRVRARLRDGLLGAEAARLRPQGLRPFVRAHEVEELDDGRVRLRYEFRADSELRDFVAVGRTSPARRARNNAELVGEYRLLRGEPFRDRLEVRGLVARFERDAPNVNIALWTAAEDRLTFAKGGDVSWLTKLSRRPGTPRDWFVFGTGYRNTVATMMEADMEKLLFADGSGRVIELPANVVLAGQHGHTLHLDTGECIWAAEGAATGRSRGFAFEIRWEREGQVTWAVDGRSVRVDEEGVDGRIPASGLAGSVSVVTNGHRVSFEELEIVGELAPEWLDARRDAKAMESLAEVAAPLVP